MEDKELLIKAIEHYTFYTSVQRKLLKLLVQIEINHVIRASILELSKITKISRASIYRILSIFQRDGIISLPNKQPSKLNQIILIPEKLELIKDNFLKKTHLQL